MTSCSTNSAPPGRKRRLQRRHQIIIPAEHAKDAESRRIPFEPKGRLAQLLKRRRFLGPKAFVFGAATGEYQGTIRTAWAGEGSGPPQFNRCSVTQT